MTPQQKAEYLRRLEAQRRAEQQRRGNEQRPKYRKRKGAKPNVGLIFFAAVICVVVGISVHQISKNSADPVETDSLLQTLQDVERGETTNTPAEQEQTPPPFETEGENTVPAVEFSSVSVNSADINQGDLILVNYEHPYSLADTVDTVEVYSNKTASYYLSTTNHRLTERALNAMNRYADGFAADTGLSEILVVSAYRSMADQQSVWDSKVQSNGEEYAKNYVAVPGHSEHHTGMALDLSFYRPSDGASVPISEHEQGFWMTEHCAEYGFILRYPESKVDITKISYEPWHFRFVGKPHAAVIMRKGLCLEEYIAQIKNYTPDTKLLHALEDGTTAEVTASELPTEGYVIYYVPSAETEATEIPVPSGYENYIISGNNWDGFIVTVYVGKESQ
ncbi:MAG: D-alanyl-D-alanine carboxypeptidase family protein [Ruminococcaceae bacterium]|nr:D-alanyl-D-alanine carboxypeptidase family protein [Oscillospiraceae bacterium]